MGYSSIKDDLRIRSSCEKPELSHETHDHIQYYSVSDEFSDKIYNGSVKQFSLRLPLKRCINHYYFGNDIEKDPDIIFRGHKLKKAISDFIIFKNIYIRSIKALYLYIKPENIKDQIYCTIIKYSLRGRFFIRESLLGRILINKKTNKEHKVLDDGTIRLRIFTGSQKWSYLNNELSIECDPYLKASVKFKISLDHVKINVKEYKLLYNPLLVSTAAIPIADFGKGYYIIDVRQIEENNGEYIGAMNLVYIVFLCYDYYKYDSVSIDTGSGMMEYEVDFIDFFDTTIYYITLDREDYTDLNPSLSFRNLVTESPIRLSFKQFRLLAKVSLVWARNL